jgi:hypothetical protein
MRGRLLVGALLCFLPTSAPADPLQAVVQGAAARIAAEIKGRSLGTGEFRLVDGRLTEISVYLAEQFDVAMIQRSGSFGFEVINRSDLCQVIRENKLWIKDAFDPALAQKLGNLKGVELLLSGRLADRGGQIAVSVRLVETASGKSVWADSLNVRSDPDLRRQLNNAAISDPCLETASAALPAPTPLPGALQVKVWTDKSQYRIGETVRFQLKTNRDAHITLVDIGTSGGITMLFPNRFHQSHFVKGGETVTIPPPDAGFNLVVDGPPGIEQVRVIATEEPVKFHPDDFPGQRGTFRSLSRGESRILTRDITAERAKVLPSRWAEDVITLQILR